MTSNNDLYKNFNSLVENLLQYDNIERDIIERIMILFTTTGRSEVIFLYRSVMQKITIKKFDKVELMMRVEEMWNADPTIRCDIRIRLADFKQKSVDDGKSLENGPTFLCTLVERSNQ